MSERKRSRSGNPKLQDKHEKPDSTTKFSEGEEVFVQKNDSFVLGIIKEVNSVSESCLVNIDDGENLWVTFKNLKPWTVDVDESPIKCNVCKRTNSKKKNVVVSCDICFRGYHQKCHQPVIETVRKNWICKKCRRKQQSHVDMKTITDSPLPTNKKRRNCQRNAKAQISRNSYKGQKVCIKSASTSVYGNELRKSSSRVKEKSPENKTTVNSIYDATMHDLPLTPPSSISAPETPQTLTVNGDLPVSPIDEISNMDFSDTASLALENCNLDELFSSLDERSSDKSFPLQLNPVINAPPVRTTKRHLSKKDLVNGKIKKRRFRRQSNVGIRPIDPALPSTSQSRGELRINPSPALNRTISKGDLKSQVFSYFNSQIKPSDEYDNLARFRSSNDYRICGKRKTSDGCVQYLIEWVQCTDPL